MRSKVKSHQKILLVVAIYVGLVSTLFLGGVLGFVSDVCIHEIGHYTFAYVFNKTAIYSFECSPYETLLGIFNLSNTTQKYAVEYKSPIVEVFKPYQIPFVVLGGLAFEMIAFYFLARYSHKLLTRWKGDLTIKTALCLSFFSGLLIAFSVMLYGWTMDGKFIVSVFIECVQARLLVMFLGVVVVVFYYFYFAWSFWIKYLSMIKQYFSRLRDL